MRRIRDTHVQFLRATMDRFRRPYKEGDRSTPLMGVPALRSERVFEFVFPEDPFYPLFVAYRRNKRQTTHQGGPVSLLLQQDRRRRHGALHGRTGLR